MRNEIANELMQVTMQQNSNIDPVEQRKQEMDKIYENFAAYAEKDSTITLEEFRIQKKRKKSLSYHPNGTDVLILRDQCILSIVEVRISAHHSLLFSTNYRLWGVLKVLTL